MTPSESGVYTGAETEMDAEPDLLLAFLRTRSDPAELSSPQRLQAWMVDQGLLGAGAPVTETDVRRFVHVRAALLSLIAQHMGAPPDARTQRTLESVTRAAPLHVVVASDGSLALAAAGSGVDNALANLVATAYQLSMTGRLERLKACKGCGWAFYDVTKNKSRVWCDMATCGSRQKARDYRARQAAGSKQDFVDRS